jgi:hypothetical protein
MEYICMVCAGAIAYGNGRSVWKWALAAYFLSWLAPLIVMFLPKNHARIERRKEIEKEVTEDYLAGKELKGVKTVDDLFKQLETK